MRLCMLESLAELHGDETYVLVPREFRGTPLDAFLQQHFLNCDFVEHALGATSAISARGRRTTARASGEFGGLFEAAFSFS